MKVVNRVSRDALISVAAGMRSNSEEILRSFEDDFACDRMVNHFKSRSELTVEERHYLQLTSLPWFFGELPECCIECYWNTMKCKACKNVVYRRSMPTGNMKPRYFVVGDAPGVGSGEFEDKAYFDRMWVYGPSSKMLRSALRKAGIYEQCWFTNQIRCSTPGNRPTTEEERKNCLPNLQKEIDLMRPKAIFLLGNAARKTRLNPKKARVFGVNHPSYMLYRHMTAGEYAKQFEKGLEKLE